MAKEKLGKKDIFTPAEKVERVGKGVLESPVGLEESKVERTGQGGEGTVGTEAARMVIHSFRIREDLVEKVREYAFFERTKIYQVVNRALEQFLKGYKPKKRALAS